MRAKEPESVSLENQRRRLRLACQAGQSPWVLRVQLSKRCPDGPDRVGVEVGVENRLTQQLSRELLEGQDPIPVGVPDSRCEPKQSATLERL